MSGDRITRDSRCILLGDNIAVQVLGSGSGGRSVSVNRTTEYGPAGMWITPEVARDVARALLDAARVAEEVSDDS